MNKILNCMGERLEAGTGNWTALYLQFLVHRRCTVLVEFEARAQL